MPPATEGVNGLSGTTVDIQSSPPSGFTLVGSSNTTIPSLKALEEMDEKDLAHQASPIQFIQIARIRLYICHSWTIYNGF